MPPRLLHRLAGLETEYVARFRPDDAAANRPVTSTLLLRLKDELKRRVPLVPADHPKDGYFLATGGAVWHEQPGAGDETPLIEGSTPECRGPMQLLTCQRAQDRLLAAAARDVSGGDFTLCKSDCDADGNVYGSQENYEADLARGWRLFAWRAGVVLLLLPLIALGWAGVLSLALVLLAYLAAAGAVYTFFLLATALAGGRVPSRRRVRNALFGPPDGPVPLVPAWVLSAATAAEPFIMAPAALALWALADLLAFRAARRALLPLLVSRCVLAGNGRLCPDGAFHLASKASGIRFANGVGIWRTHSIFSFGPQAKALMFFSLAAGRIFPSLLAGRQRLQICLGDGNLCDEAEYLRVGTTMLVLDAVEAGHPIPVPALRRPMAALRAFCADPTLTARVPARGGRSVTALDLQRIYLRACQSFVAAQPQPQTEATALLERWEQVLDDLPEVESSPVRLVGRLDWVTKRWLMETTGGDASWEARKKIDLRYHELSPDGYFERLRSAGVVRAILSDEQVESATAAPPPDTPATRRGAAIRRHAADTSTRASWLTVTFGSPKKVIRLDEG